MIKTFKDFINEGETNPTTPALDVRYWTDWHQDAQKITSISRVANAVEDEVQWWNSLSTAQKLNTYSETHEIEKEDEKKVMNLAHDFFKATGWISTDIIKAMIARSVDWR